MRVYVNVWASIERSSCVMGGLKAGSWMAAAGSVHSVHTADAVLSAAPLLQHLHAARIRQALADDILTASNLHTHTHTHQRHLHTSLLTSQCRSNTRDQLSGAATENNAAPLITRTYPPSRSCPAPAAAHRGVVAGARPAPRPRPRARPPAEGGAGSPLETSPRALLGLFVAMVGCWMRARLLAALLSTQQPF